MSSTEGSRGPYQCRWKGCRSSSGHRCSPPRRHALANGYCRNSGWLVCSENCCLVFLVGGRRDWDIRFLWSFVSTLSKTNMAPENRPSQKESSLPTLTIQGCMSMLNFGGVTVLFALQSSKTQYLPPPPKKKHHKNVMFHVFSATFSRSWCKFHARYTLEKHVEPKNHLKRKIIWTIHLHDFGFTMSILLRVWPPLIGNPFRYSI